MGCIYTKRLANINESLSSTSPMLLPTDSVSYRCWSLQRPTQHIGNESNEGHHDGHAHDVHPHRFSAECNHITEYVHVPPPRPNHTLTMHTTMESIEGSHSGWSKMVLHTAGRPTIAKHCEYGAKHGRHDDLVCGSLLRERADEYNRVRERKAWTTFQTANAPVQVCTS